MSVQNTRAGAKEISAVLSGARKLWFIGIGGIHMASLALFASKRFSVAGSDRREGEGTARLRAAGIPVRIGHSPDEARQADVVIYTLAIAPDDPEYLAAKEAGVPLFSRADFLGCLMVPFANRVGVAGSHGKSTVTAMAAEIFKRAGRSPTVFCGASVRALGGPFCTGEGEDFIFEACEYEDSFLSFCPTLAVILNVELDHVDYFSDEAALERSFAAYGALPGKSGLLLTFSADAAAARCAAESPSRKVTFGNEDADYAICGSSLSGGYGRFSLRMPDGAYLPVSLRVPGSHNVTNAAAAAAIADLCKIPREEIATGLSCFRGAERRLAYRGTFFGARFYDDYAHHPTEIAASLCAARLLLGCGGRLITVFQSHTYSRTAAFFREFCEALRLSDRVIVADIYAARESETLGMSGERLAAGIGESACYVGGFSEIAAELAKSLSPLDLVVVMGAGDVTGLFAEIERFFS